MAKLLFQGHGSFRLTSAAGQIVYIDPFAGEGYDIPADLILVSHQHGDHNQVELCVQKPHCCVITNTEALADGVHQSFEVDGIGILAVQAYNQNHSVNECVGFIVTVDGVKIYFSADTSTTDDMAGFAAMKLDYAILCGDGVYNMDMAEAAECAKLIGAKHNILVHTTPGVLYDADKTAAWDAPNKLIVAAGEEIQL